MKNIRLFTAVSLLAVLLVSCGGNSKKVSIELSFDTKGESASNYLNWSAGDLSVKDGFDAATGASKAQTTTLFDAVRYDGTEAKKAAIPGSLRSLVLFPVASYSTAEGDNFTVTENGKQLTITFVHRGTATQITTDANGKFNTTDSFKVASGVADNIGGKFLIKDEFLKEGGNKANMADLDWSKVSLTADTTAPDAAVKYNGELTASMKDGVLSVKGTLKAE